MPLSKKNFMIKPSNNTTDGFSHSKGNPVIQISIPAQDLLLETSSLHLTGRVLEYNKAGELISLDGADVDISTADDGTEAMEAPVSLNLSNFGGVHNCIDKIVIKSKKSSVELVNDSNYGQFTATRECYSFNKEDYLRIPLTRSLSSGNNCDLVNRRLVNTYSPDGRERQGQEFSLKLNIPFLGTQPIHLGQEFCGGLVMTLYLSPDSNVFFNRFRNSLFNGGINDNTGSYYILKDLMLCGRYLVPSPQDLKAYNPEITYGGKVNLINDVVSSVNSNGYTPQVQFAKSIINQFQRGDAINNYSINSNNFPQLVGLEKVVQSKNGMRFPYQYAVNVTPNARSLRTDGTQVTPEALQFKSLGMGDTEVRLQHMRAVLNGNEPYHSSSSLAETEDEVAQEYAPALNTDYGNNCFVDITGIGADYSMNLGLTQNFVNQDYALETTSGVNTGRDNLPDETSSMSMLQQTFIKDVEVVNTKTLVKVF
jgi:hypothetical protein